MKILFLTQIIPWPVDAGPKVKTWNVLRFLHDQGHEILLASFVRSEEEKYLPVMREVCKTVYPISMRRSRYKDVYYYLRSLVHRRPFLIERDDLVEMRALVKQILHNEHIDVIHADQLSMAQFACQSLFPNERPGATSTMNHHAGPVLIFDAHNAVWTIFDRLCQNSNWLVRPLLSYEAQRIKRYEGLIVNAFDHTLAVTEADAAALRQAEQLTTSRNSGRSGEMSIIPIAVDGEALMPVARDENSLNILTLGTLHYPPNADGIRWFTNEVFPLVKSKVPGARLTIIGKNPPKDLSQVANDPDNGVQVTGYVPNLTPYFQAAAVLVVPVRAGGGMRVRILEAFARGMPVVTTTIGLEGIDARPGMDVLVGDTPQAFADEVVKVLSDKALQHELAVNGRKLVEQKYDFRVVLHTLGDIYRQYADLSSEVPKVVLSAG
jgi:glycosyltransferase involved in cell wall biosynthesis